MNAGDIKSFLRGKFIAPKMLKKLKEETVTDKKKIAFQSFPDFSDSAEALCDYILENEEPNEYEIHWFVQKIDVSVPEKYKGRVHVHDARVRCGDYCEEAVKAAYSCGIIFFTHDFILRSSDRKDDQFVFCLWHGCGVKAAGLEKAPAAFDYITITGPAFYGITGPTFRVGRDKMVPLGYPRNDIMKQGTKTGESFAKQLAPKGEKIIVWMPTFRKSILSDCDEAKGKRAGDLPLVEGVENLRKIDEECGKTNTVLVVKRHPFQPVYSEEQFSFSNIKFISNRDLEIAGVETYALLHESVGLISDYSSVATDYMLLDRPMAFSIEDFDEYQENRGFAMDNPLDYLPGYYLRTSEDLLKFIQDISKGVDKSKEKRNEMNKTMNVESQCYSRDIWEFVKDKVNG